jgi:hypothetical protein
MMILRNLHKDYRFTKSRSIRWMGHVGCLGEMRNATQFWSENLKGRDHLLRMDIDEELWLK